jgi:uncharacterized protein
MKIFPAVLLFLLLSFSTVHAGSGSRDYNPGLKAYVEATRLYESAEYTSAYQRYQQSARWGNKLSQFNIGTMYYNGIGVARDPARSWAWIELSAERSYPQLVQAASEIWGELDDNARQRAKRILEEELKPEYADAVALPRTQRFVNRRYRSATGSRLGGGAASNPLLVQPRDHPHTVGDVYYREDEWRVDRWLEQEAAWFEQMMQAGEPVAEFEEID